MRAHRVMLALIAAGCAVPSAAHGGSVAALDHLAGVRNPATGAPSVPGDQPTRVRAIAAWAALAAAGAGEDPAAWRTGGRSLAGAIGRRPSGPVLALARWAVAAQASRRLSRRDRAALVVAFTAAQDPSGAIGTGDLETAWALLALRAADAPATSPVAESLAALRARQRADGGWASGTEPRSDTAATAAAVQALAAWGEPPAGPAAARARAWLRATQRPDGGFAPVPGRRATAVDTAWAALGIWALGESPRARPWARRGGPLALLDARQRPDGGVSDLPGGPASTFATALTVLALRGRPLPVRPGTPGIAADRAPRVVRRSPAPGTPAGRLLNVAFRDEPGGTGVDPAAARLLVGGVDVTRLARVSRFSLQIPTSLLGPLPAELELRLADRAGNRRVLRWRVGEGG